VFNIENQLYVAAFLSTIQTQETKYDIMTAAKLTDHCQRMAAGSLLAHHIMCEPQYK
jgi:hypothetical protein